MNGMDDKKKLMIIGALGVVLLGIGAFQFTKGSAPAAAQAPATTQETPAATPEDPANAEQPQAEQANNLVTGSYPRRDPFKPLIDPNATVSTVAQNTPVQQPMRIPGGRKVDFPIEKFGPLPGADPAGGEAETVKPLAPEFPYKLSGIIVGAKPAAVFTDLSGAQRLVELGGSLDGDTQLVNMDRNHVVLRFKNQTKNLTLGGGNSSAN